MAKTIVSIRMPKNLINKAKQIAQSQNYLDVSEFVRSVVRKQYLRSKDPIAYELKTLQINLQRDFKTASEAKQREWLLKQLEQLRGGQHEN